MNIADNYKKNKKTDKAGKDSQKKEAKPASSENGGRVNINVFITPEECDDKLSISKRDICQSALATLSSVYYCYREEGHPIDYETRDFLDTLVSTVLNDIFMLDKAGGKKPLLMGFYELYKETCSMEVMTMSAEDYPEQDEEIDKLADYLRNTEEGEHEQKVTEIHTVEEEEEFLGDPEAFLNRTEEDRGNDE